jgi:3-methylfumaryl-CoA hydratase
LGISGTLGTKLQGVHEGGAIPDIVYCNPSQDRSAAIPKPSPAAQHEKPFTPDATMLFRYSALTFNGHRIHYDADYCRNVEGYPDLVIHGPLSATMLAGFAEEASGRKLRHFTYRGLRPALLGTELMLKATIEGEQACLWTELPDGNVSMQAEAMLDGEGGQKPDDL